MKLNCATMEMKASEQYFHAVVVLFIVLQKMGIPTFKSVDKTLA